MVEFQILQVDLILLQKLNNDKFLNLLNIHIYI